MECIAAQPLPAVRVRPKTRAAILVVEDSRFVREVTCDILRQAGYRVLPAEGGTAARKVFRRYRKKIQLLLCDAVLPDSSGIALSQNLCQLSAGLKVIIVSGYPRGATPKDYESESAREFLAKPYCAASLVLKVQMALQRGGAR